DKLPVDVRDKMIALNLHVDSVECIVAHGEGQFHLGLGTSLSVDDCIALERHFGYRTGLKDDDPGGEVVVEVHRPINETQSLAVDLTDKIHAIVSQGNGFDVDPKLARMGEAGLIADPVPELAAAASPAAHLVPEILVKLHARAGANCISEG